MKHKETKEIYELLKQARVKLMLLTKRGIKSDYLNACDNCDDSIGNTMSALRNIDRLLG